MKKTSLTVLILLVLFGVCKQARILGFKDGKCRLVGKGKNFFTYDMKPGKMRRFKPHAVCRHYDMVLEGENEKEADVHVTLYPGCCAGDPCWNWKITEEVPCFYTDQFRGDWVTTEHVLDLWEESEKNYEEELDEADLRRGLKKFAQLRRKFDEVMKR